MTQITKILAYDHKLPTVVASPSEKEAVQDFMGRRIGQDLVAILKEANSTCMVVLSSSEIKEGQNILKLHLEIKITYEV